MAGRNKFPSPPERQDAGPEVAALDPARTGSMLFGEIPVHDAAPAPRNERRDSADVREMAARTIGEAGEKLGWTPPPEPPPSQPYERAIASAKEAQAEVERLRKLLADQQKAAVDALHTALASEKRLADNKAEAEKRRDVLMAEPGRKGAPSSAQEAGLVRATLERTQKDLERERAARAVEAERNTQKIHVLEKQLVVATSISQSIQKVRSRQLQKKIAVGVCVALAGAGIGLWIVMHASRGSSTAGKTQTLNAEAGQVETIVEQPEHQNTSLPAAANSGWEASDRGSSRTPFQDPRGAKGLVGHQSDVTNSVSRLSQALAKFQGQDPEIVLRAINHRNAANGKAAVCPFEWRNDQPALVLGNSIGAAKLTSMVGELNSCADAVENYR